MAILSSAARTILAINCGSSSLKFGVYACEANGTRLIYEGEAEEIGQPSGSFWIRKAGEQREEARLSFADHAAALDHAFSILTERAAACFDAAGHRFVHGGPRLREHTLVTAEVLKTLESAVEYAPLHLPAALATLKAVQQKLPGVPQAVCLDTAFHRKMPDVSKTYALPENVRELGVERYGFHGLSLESIVAQLQPIPERLVAAHLGNGSSITAIRNGISVDTSMGLTPTGGVMMGTRCGDLDPGLIVFLLRHGFEGSEQLEQVFDHKSGLLGVSGASSDVRELVSRRAQDSKADLALRMFCYQVRKAIAGMAAALGGLDKLVFTGGIGEHASDLREEICAGLAFLGQFATEVLPSQEDEQIAKNTAKLV